MTSGRDKKQVPYETPWRAPLTQATGTGQSHLIQYIVDFTNPNGTSAWWEVLFNSIEEATRWGEWELERIASGQAGWTAEIGKGHWEHDKETAKFVMDVERLASVGSVHRHVARDRNGGMTPSRGRRCLAARDSGKSLGTRG